MRERRKKQGKIERHTEKRRGTTEKEGERKTVKEREIKRERKTVKERERKRERKTVKEREREKDSETVKERVT